MAGGIVQGKPDKRPAFARISSSVKLYSKAFANLKCRVCTTRVVVDGGGLDVHGGAGLTRQS